MDRADLLTEILSIKNSPLLEEYNRLVNEYFLSNLSLVNLASPCTFVVRACFDETGILGFSDGLFRLNFHANDIMKGKLVGYQRLDIQCK